MTFWCVVSQRASASPELLQTLQLESRYTHSSFQTFQERKIPWKRMEEATSEFWTWHRNSEIRAAPGVRPVWFWPITEREPATAATAVSPNKAVKKSPGESKWLPAIWPSLSRRRCCCFWWLHFEIGHRHGGCWRRLWMVSSNEPPKLKPRKKQNQMQYTQVWRTCWPQEIHDLRLVWSLEKVWNMLCWNAAFVRFIGPCSSFWHSLAIQPLLKVYEDSLNLHKKNYKNHPNQLWEWYGYGYIYRWVDWAQTRQHHQRSRVHTIQKVVQQLQACCIRICLCSCCLKTFPTLRSEVPCQLPKVDPGSHFSFTFWEQLRSCR